MVLEIAELLLGTCVGAVVAVYASSKGYLGHRRTKVASITVPSTASIAAATEQAKEVPTVAAPAATEPAPSPAPAPSHAIYETVQPAPAPVTYAAPAATSFSSPTLAKKPTRTYRRRTAPVRSSAGVKKTLSKPKKR
ncbi:MAG: hypothetical protein JRN45_11405 [Nitrososphaerota archaeon]|nr:hypothetical protein [Nitrososphaerota archaeon]